MSAKSIFVLGESLMDCVAQPDGQLRPHMGGSPFNLVRAAALRGAHVGYLNPISTDIFGQQLLQRLEIDGVQIMGSRSALPTSLAVVQINHGQPHYSFYREGVADRDYSVEGIITLLAKSSPGILHTVGSLALIPPDHEKILAIVKQAKAWGWVISVDINLRPLSGSDLTSYRDAIQELASLTDWLKASDEDWASLGLGSLTPAQADEAVQFFAAKGAQRIAITFGDQGAYLDVDGHSALLPVPKINVTDTVGAGDTFWGNCLADWATQSDDAKDRVRTTLAESMLAAAINCSRAGCQPPTAAELHMNRFL